MVTANQGCKWHAGMIYFRKPYKNKKIRQVHKKYLILYAKESKRYLKLKKIT